MNNVLTFGENFVWLASIKLVDEMTIVTIHDVFDYASASAPT